MIRISISPCRNGNYDLYWHDLKSDRQRSQFLISPGRNPNFNFCRWNMKADQILISTLKFAYVYVAYFYGCCLSL